MTEETQQRLIIWALVTVVILFLLYMFLFSTYLHRHTKTPEEIAHKKIKVIANQHYTNENPYVEDVISCFEGCLYSEWYVYGFKNTTIGRPSKMYHSCSQACWEGWRAEE